nr:follistatin-related protein 4-like [Lepeophtheirus salmonis]
MWSRDLPFALLAIDGEPHLEDPRIWVEKPNMNDTESDTSDWILAIRKVEREDNGTYKCQTSDHPPKYILTHLFTVEAMAIIDGPKEKFMKGGSRLRLVCHFHNVTQVPETIFWYLNDRMINYDTRFGIDFIANGTILTIASINSELTGNFTCAPLSITPDSVRVHIIDEEGAAVYGDSGNIPSLSRILLSTSLVYNYYSFLF